MADDTNQALITSWTDTESPMVIKSRTDWIIKAPGDR